MEQVASPRGEQEVLVVVAVEPLRVTAAVAQAPPRGEQAVLVVVVAVALDMEGAQTDLAVAAQVGSVVAAEAGMAPMAPAP